MILLYDVAHYQILSSDFHLDGILNELDGSVSINYMNVQSKLSNEQTILSITFQKTSPIHDLSKISLGVREAIYVNIYNRPEHVDYLITQWMD